jgi:hypothetical protein
MPKQLCLSAVIELPDDLFEASEIVNSVKVPWYAALQTLKEKGVKFAHQQDMMEVRAKPAGARRGRKPRLAAVPQDAA